MSVYDISGNSLLQVYTSTEEVRYNCYDISGNELLPIGSDYYEDENGIKRNISLVEIGSLKYVQAFCVFDGKYYSTDGSHIAEQNGNFTVLRDVTLNLGHGNALQLGSNGMAYASGWDDQKIYVVDLYTLTIIDTIALPTTGYTTCAVDDNNHLAYIWQRDTRPNTESPYNFIVYDYANEQVISSIVTTVSFGAMQAVDWYDDLILVLNGLGTDALPNGYRFYNKFGLVVGQYVIGSQSTVEPEGVSVNKDTNEVLISYADKKVYKIQNA